MWNCLFGSLKRSGIFSKTIDGYGIFETLGFDDEKYPEKLIASHFFHPPFMGGSDDDFAELNRGFDELLIKSDEERHFVDNGTTVQSLIVPVELNSFEDDDDHKSNHDEEEKWIEVAIIHDQFSFVEEYAPSPSIVCW